MQLSNCFVANRFEIDIYTVSFVLNNEQMLLPVLRIRNRNRYDQKLLAGSGCDPEPE